MAHPPASIAPSSVRPSIFQPNNTLKAGATTRLYPQSMNLFTEKVAAELSQMALF
mgnify:FL=1